MPQRSAVVLIAIVIFGSVAEPRSQSDPMAPLAGTWGQPPIDGKPGLTGSIFTAYRDSRGESRINLIFAPPSGWTCSITDQAVRWNDAERRFEWPNQSTRVKAPSCWVQADPHADVLDVRMFCPYSCTKASDVNALQLSRMSATRLVAPKTVVETFCSSPDPLRHAMCTPGPLQERIAESERLANQVDVLDDGLDRKSVEPETEVALLEILNRCHAGNRDQTLRRRRIARAYRAAEAAGRQRQLALETEQKRSDSRAMALPDEKPPAGWERSRSLVSDEVISSLEIDDCDKVVCGKLSSETNYTFGPPAAGLCSIDASVKFTGRCRVRLRRVAESDQNEAAPGDLPTSAEWT